MTAQPGIKARGPGRPAYAKTTSCAAIFAYDCGAHTAHEVYYTMSAKRHGIIDHRGESGPCPRIALAIRLV
ncbi:hypothetical protein ANACOL_02771 [Anaerotruncus colihominis DSM 17241]|uniref:Uncharacterized protein n=1 Tax=Anaerotruncus colihominis DSM 17241 TaxID=445972 RepID=B0PDY6_9FIRM|nr:hypothetical protein ANACOL_02771 [Anaerotruncus colihominis DSM 17241]